MAAPDVSATKQRILDAAVAEFGAYGLAGARIDRIASAAKASKERLYAYFGDKVALFHAVLDTNFAEAMERLSFDGADLPDQAVALFDDMLAKPDIQRMMIWGQLQGESIRMRELAESHPSWERRIGAIRRAQSDGIVDARWDPAELVTMMFGIVFGWLVAPCADGNDGLDEAGLAHRREVVREAVRRICQG
ncbi:TetR family transcriptional regulator [Rhodococcus kronopolitis]|uniref:TetR family transcriptional regulator n=1 Tax=Rhodococcus kronopolitis TaxID=1460226 RepID=A0ABV9FVD7_9NOCA